MLPAFAMKEPRLEPFWDFFFLFLPSFKFLNEHLHFHQQIIRLLSTLHPKQ